MVHISDGVLPPAMLAAGFLFTIILLILSMRGMMMEEIPKISLITAALFVASLVHFPVGPTSVHLIMNGLAGILLGRRAFVGVFVALTLQAVFFQHGGLTVLGVNAFNIGVPALFAWQLFERRRGLESPHLEVVFGALAGGLAVLMSVLMVSLELLALGEAFTEISLLVIGAHLPVILIETAVVGGAAGFLFRVKPEMLADSNSRTMEVN
ncbi:MAG: cobalt transporter CbiM [Methanothrix sp.]|jgi:cobalt/nickel transport system permease protein|uniref:cobalt transporter CbiM n=1 Tax=Methanothrix sp. TaxID=90426 RepID=UPI001BD385E5|nr:cobalt transporter CbiM [Methanothrix sp.]MBK7385832.1 cobalt transporter CbiM [Methanothrix sp.]HPW72802.1 cobalt transporter CbiM [Methanothrix sp.]